MLNFTNNCYLKVENNIYMTKNAITWLREDFRIEHNPALSYATQNHENVIALYIYNSDEYDNKREAQKWWLSKSLDSFKKDLYNYKINLEILKGNELDILSKIKKIQYVDSIGFFASLALKIFGYNTNSGLGSRKSIKFYDKYIFPVSKIFDMIGLKYLFGKNLLIIAKK